MPKQTFFNLSDEKRDHIIEVAIRTFAECGYQEASITSIVARAGIAKGSFYQYFEDKDDLYLHILRSIAEFKIKIYKREFEGSAHVTLTEFLRRVAHMQLREFKEAPLLQKVGLDFARARPEPVTAKFYESMQGVADSVYIAFIEEEKKCGRLDSKVDTELLNCMLASVGQYLTAWVESRGDDEITPANVDVIVDKLEYILTHGIYSNN